MILVTGGTGLVGSHVLLYLCQKHDKVRAIFRNESKIKKVKHVFEYYQESNMSFFDRIEWVQADIIDLPALEKVFEGVEYVYHCAAMVSFDPSDYHALRKSNIEGTANIVNLCLNFGIKKIAYMSSVAALGGKDLNDPIREDSPWNSDGDHNVYAITKYGAEMEIWRGVQEGLDCIIVNPGIIVGPGFWKSSSGSLFTRVFRGMRYYSTAINGYVDIHDVVKTFIQLMESDITNERFIQVAENLSSKSFIDMIAQAINAKSPEKSVSPLILKFGWRYDWLRAKLLGKRRRLTRHLAKILTKDTYYDNSKLKKTLNFEYKPISQSVEETAVLFNRDQA
ncbi:MAG: NAD-dependent epimerase/dehydratase family protein [Flavobacteriaceae bacterium]|nr:NAD-dependent epimerase/dehydratase family protein [Bacteroidia bacterium]NNF73993.1 NAD-dependent epimerase/dehydratase family protein [Flavobacteriaceae bacterium]NNK72859.1 NAD-dependent epimerase/dehydratase family protein [Flavobacteriaceae bacterium]